MVILCHVRMHIWFCPFNMSHEYCFINILFSDADIEEARQTSVK